MKIMTAVVAIENKNLDDVVEIGEEVLPMYGSNIYIEVGEKMTLRDLLYGLLLRSGNDAAVAMSHTVEELLNQFRRIGARHNHGVNETEEHGGCNAHLHIREPESDNEQENDRKKRSKGPKDIGMLGQFNIALVHAFVFKTTLLEVAKNETGNRQENNTNDGNQKRTETRIGNEIHHRPFSELGHETVMGRTRRPEGRQG